MKISAINFSISVKVPILVIFITAVWWSCPNRLMSKNNSAINSTMYSVTDPKQVEIDELYSLLAYSIVYSNWQEDSVPRNKRRGYNIGCVLVNQQNKLVGYALNSVGVTNNSTQHAEVRLMTQYLDSVRSFDLKNHTIYSTLEPCPMCAGMMTMTLVARTVYGQNDVEYSHAFERLAFDSRSIGGYAPFPRNVIAEPSPSEFTKELNQAYQLFLQTDPEKILAKFLVSKKAKDIYRKANQAFIDYQVKFAENRTIYSESMKFYEHIGYKK